MNLRIIPRIHLKSCDMFISAGWCTMPDYVSLTSMTSLTLDAIAGKAEDAVVVDYILKGKNFVSFALETISTYQWHMHHTLARLCDGAGSSHRPQAFSAVYELLCFTQFTKRIAYVFVHIILLLKAVLHIIIEVIQYVYESGISIFFLHQNGILLGMHSKVITTDQMAQYHSLLRCTAF